MVWAAELFGEVWAAAHCRLTALPIFFFFKYKKGKSARDILHCFFLHFGEDDRMAEAADRFAAAWAAAANWHLSCLGSLPACLRTASRQPFPWEIQSEKNTILSWMGGPQTLHQYCSKRCYIANIMAIKFTNYENMFILSLWDWYRRFAKKKIH